MIALEIVTKKDGLVSAQEYTTVSVIVQTCLQETKQSSNSIMLVKSSFIFYLYLNKTGLTRVAILGDLNEFR